MKTFIRNLYNVLSQKKINADLNIVLGRRCHDSSTTKRTSTTTIQTVQMENEIPFNLQELRQTFVEMESLIGYNRTSLNRKLYESLPFFNQSSSFMPNIKWNRTYLNQLQREIFENDQSDDDDNQATATTMTTTSSPFELIKPKESFLILLIAQMMNIRFDISKSSDPMMHKHLFMLLSIIQLIRDGANSRNLYQISSTTNHDQRWSLLKGNFYFYNVTHLLLRLNIRNINKWMNRSLQDMVTIQLWIEREIIGKFIQSNRSKTISIGDGIRHQLSNGDLYPLWQFIIHNRDCVLMERSCQSLAYLFGKSESSTQSLEWTRFGSTLAIIFSLIDDISYLEQQRKQQQQNEQSMVKQHELESSLQYFLFIIRLPVLFHLKQTSIVNEERCCQILVNNVIKNIHQSDSLPMARALIEYHVTIADKLIRKMCPDESSIRQTFLSMLNACTKC